MSLAGTLEREPGNEFRRGMLSAPDYPARWNMVTVSHRYVGAGRYERR
jgi:hypothetical protein